MTLEQMKDLLETYRHDINYLDRIYDVFPCDSIFDSLRSPDKLLRIVDEAFGDHADWIGYFIFELEYGKRYHSGMVQDKNGKDIPLATYEDLYNLLISEKEGNK